MVLIRSCYDNKRFVYVALSEIGHFLWQLFPGTVCSGRLDFLWVSGGISRAPESERIVLVQF